MKYEKAIEHGQRRDRLYTMEVNNNNNNNFVAENDFILELWERLFSVRYFLQCWLEMGSILNKSENSIVLRY